MCFSDPILVGQYYPEVENLSLTLLMALTQFDRSGFHVLVNNDVLLIRHSLNVAITMTHVQRVTLLNF